MRGCALLGACMMLAVAGPADACRSSAYTLAIVHSGLPDRLPPDLFVAEVEFESADAATLRRNGLRARVTRQIQGEPAGEHILVRAPRGTSCSRPFANGTSGLLVGSVVGREAGELVVSPRQASRKNGFRLR